MVSLSHELTQHVSSNLVYGSRFSHIFYIWMAYYCHELSQYVVCTNLGFGNNCSHIFYIWIASCSLELTQHVFSDLVFGSNCSQKFHIWMFFLLMNWLIMSIQTWFMEAAVVIWLAYYSLELSQYVVWINLGFWEQM